MNRLLRRRYVAGFTLVEMLVSVAVLVILVLVLTQLISGLRMAIAGTSAQIGEFSEARDAFETMTRRIGQATLNSYDDTLPLSAVQPGTPRALTSGSNYARASELRFIIGTGQTLLSGTGIYPTHAIFFHAPLGYTHVAAYAGLVNILNTCGYYIQWNSDLSYRPGFLQSATVPAQRYRMRLMEMLDPSEDLPVYRFTSGPARTVPSGLTSASVLPSNSWYYTGQDWFQIPFTATSPPIHPIADNVILLAMLPMVAPQNAQYPVGGAPDGTSTDISGPYNSNLTAPPYSYDSSMSSGRTPDSRNALPPLVWVMMIAVDEKSFARYETDRGIANAANDPSANLGLTGGQSPILSKADYTDRQSDIATVVADLMQYKINYRIYTAAVPLTAH